MSSSWHRKSSKPLSHSDDTTTQQRNTLRIYLSICLLTCLRRRRKSRYVVEKIMCMWMCVCGWVIGHIESLMSVLLTRSGARITSGMLAVIGDNVVDALSHNLCNWQTRITFLLYAFRLFACDKMHTHQVKSPSLKECTMCKWVPAEQLLQRDYINQPPPPFRPLSD